VYKTWSLALKPKLVPNCEQSVVKNTLCGQKIQNFRERWSGANCVLRPLQLLLYARHHYINRHDGRHGRGRAGGATTNAHNAVGRPNRKRSRGWPRRRHNDNIKGEAQKMMCEKMDRVDGIRLLTLLNTELKLRFPQGVRNFSTIWEKFYFFRAILPPLELQNCACYFVRLRSLSCTLLWTDWNPFRVQFLPSVFYTPNQTEQVTCASLGIMTLSELHDFCITEIEMRETVNSNGWRQSLFTNCTGVL
jgi:hypothetical protein